MGYVVVVVVVVVVVGRWGSQGSGPILGAHAFNPKASNPKA